MTVKYRKDATHTHLATEREVTGRVLYRSVCGDIQAGRWAFPETAGPVDCSACLAVAREAFGWVLMHYADDVQSKATTQPVVPLGQITPAGVAIKELGVQK
jgi:hypothetical protein